VVSFLIFTISAAACHIVAPHSLQRNLSMPDSQITIFSCPKSFIGHNAIIQENSLHNWCSLGMGVILLGNDPGIAEAAGKYGCCHIAELEKTEYGTPLLSDIFAKAQKACETPLICYSNADILFPFELLTAVDLVAKRFKNFLITGQRWNMDVSSLITADNVKVLMQSRHQVGELYRPDGMDYFVFPCGMVTMPPFVIGRPAWDNWMVWDALSKKIPIVDASSYITIIHQNHDYAHVPEKVSQNWEDSPESVRNRALFRTFCPTVEHSSLFSVHGAPWRISENGVLEQNTLKEHIAAKVSKRNKEFFDKSPFASALRHCLKKLCNVKHYEILRSIWHKLLLKTTGK